jgi:NitT/TauT family transport system substrate-binding protein
MEGIVALCRICAFLFMSALAVIFVGPTTSVAAEIKLKMILNWKYQGPQGWFFLAADRGYYKAEGLDLTFDQGDGSGAAVPKVASGAYDLGFGDINALIEFAASRPAEAPVAVYVIYNEPPFALAVRSNGMIKTPKDLEGKTLGGTASDGALKLFPAFCKKAGIDCTKINIIYMQPNLREQMLIHGQVDGVFGYVNTIRFGAKLIGIDPDKDMRFIKFSDYGMNLYSNSIVVSKKLIEQNPQAVRGFVRATNRGILDALNDPKAAVAAVAKREPLINAEIELERLIATIELEMSDPEIATNGLGDVDDARLKNSIAILVEANGLQRSPSPEEIFTRDFMPPGPELIKKLH